jgi:hypothetical protein
MTGRWLLAVGIVLLGCILALALDANRSLSAPPHLPQLVEPAGPAHLENMALQRDRPPPPAIDGGFMPLPYFPVAPSAIAPDANPEEPFHPERGDWNA